MKSVKTIATCRLEGFPIRGAGICRFRKNVPKLQKTNSYVYAK
jgi:hypothetical protein